MDKEKPSNPNQSLPPQSVRFTHNHNVKPEPSTSGAPPQPPQPQTGSDINNNNSGSRLYSQDISGMPDNPPKNPRHRRAHSEIITLPDDIDISFDNDMVDVGGGGGGAAGGPSYSDDTEEDLFSMYLDMDKFNSGSAFQVGEGSGGAGAGGVAAFQGSMLAAEGGGTNASGSRIRHQHSQSMDGSTSIMIKPEMLMSMSASEEFPPGDSKKAMSAAKLAELALIDPKRAKRIWANRQSAARSKERKMRYIAELERKLQTLQTEATTLSAQLSLLQRDTNGLTAENSELKLRLQTMEQQVHLQDALNDALKEEIQHLKVMTGQAMANGGPMMNFAPFGGGGGSSGQQQFYQNPNNLNAMNTLFTAQQFQQLQIHSQKQQHQFQQQQMHQLQQQLHQQQQQTGDLKLRGGTQKDNNAPDSSTKD